MWHHMAHQFNAITLSKVSVTGQMAANVVDVFIHAIEHTGTQNKHFSTLPAKVKGKFFLGQRENCLIKQALDSPAG